jgi:predicted MFS family arabinose efflux permease
MSGTFAKLWAADTVNQTGTSLRTTSIPLVGVTVLGASAWQMGILTASATAAFAVVGLPAGAWVDRFPRRRVMMLANLIRLLLLATIGAAAALRLLTFVQLVGVSLLIGAMTVLYDVASPAIVQSVVPADDLTRANGRMQTTQAAARLGGPPLAGAAAQLIGAANTTGLAGLSYLASALLIRRLPEPRPAQRTGTSLRSEVAAGLRFTFGHPAIRALVVCGAAYNFFLNLGFAVQVLFLVDELRLPSAAVGALLAASGLGQVLGAASAGAWARRFGDVRAIVVVLCVAQPFGLLLPLAGRGWAVALFATATFSTGYGIAVYNVLSLTFRQHTCPPEMFGRMSASARMLSWGAIPLGALAGGGLGQLAGLRATLWIAAVGGLLPALWLLLSPLRRMRSLTAADSDQAAVGGPAG